MDSSISHTLQARLIRLLSFGANQITLTASYNCTRIGNLDRQLLKQPSVNVPAVDSPVPYLGVTAWVLNLDVATVLGDISSRERDIRLLQLTTSVDGNIRVRCGHCNIDGAG